MLATSSVARAAPGDCEGLRLHVEGAVAPRWQTAIDHACAELSSLPGTDPTAEVRLRARDRDLTVVVTLADGRSATRHLRSPTELRGALEALLVVPPEARPAASDPALVAAAASPAAPPEGWSSSPNDIPPAAPAEAATGLSAAEPTLGVELGAGLGGRVAARGYLSAALDGLAQVRIGSWLFGAVFRWDFIGQKSAPLVKVFEMESVGAGLAVGRRFPLGFGSLDAGVSPRLVVETQSYENDSGEHSMSASDARLGAYARLALGKSSLRPVIALDGELSPARLRRVVQLDPNLPPLPSWSAGLSAAVVWGASP